MYFLRTLKLSKINCIVLHNFYKATIESVLTHAIVVWGGGISKENERKLNSVITNAAKLIGHELPFINDIYRARLLEKAKKIVKDQSHPGNKLFELLPSGRRYRSYKGSLRFLCSTFPDAVRTMNETTSKHGN